MISEVSAKKGDPSCNLDELSPLSQMLSPSRHCLLSFAIIRFNRPCTPAQRLPVPSLGREIEARQLGPIIAFYQVFIA